MAPVAGLQAGGVSVGGTMLVVAGRVEVTRQIVPDRLSATVRICACGLGKAKSLRPQPDGGVLVTDGPYLETREHIGGFRILETADMDEAIAWARKGVIATLGQVEVREIFFNPAAD